MMGTYSMSFGGNSISFPIDRLLVSPRGLTAPAVAGGAPLTANGAATAMITRGGSSVTIQDLQTKYRLCVGSPLGTAVGVIASPETFTSAQTVDQINAAFAATRQPYDIVTVVAPPAAYGAAVNTQFQAATTAPGTTIYDPTTSGAIRASATENALPVNGPVLAGDTFDALYAFDYVTTMSVPSPSADGLIGRTTIAANGTVLPTDRVFFDYALLNNSLFYNGNGSIDRFTFGVEKTLGEGHFSFEWRLPFGASVDNKVRVESGMGSDQVELGNALLILKQEIASSDTMAFTGGLGLSFPTGNDVQVANAAGSLLLDWHNDVVRLKPFLAAAYVPDEHWFFSGFMEYDVAAGSNEVQLNLYGTGLRNVGQVRDASHLFVDLQAGHWFEIDGWGLHRVAPTMELHFDRGLGDASVLRGPTYRITDISDNREYLNAVIGAVLDFSDNRYLSLGYGTGLGGDGSASDGEFRAVLNLPFKSR